jgi:mono/diheme cytochrome c family protein
MWVVGETYSRYITGLGVGLAVLWIGSGLLQAAPQAPPVSPASTVAHRALLDKYCVTCHNQRARVAGLTLDNADLGRVPEGAETWEKVIKKLNGGLMPPQGMPRPDTAAVKSLVAALESSLDRAAVTKPNPGRAAVHRLNQAEYKHAIRDLLGVDIDRESAVLADEADRQGFYNNAGVLSVSPALLERYLTSARRIARLAVGDPKIIPAVETYDVPKKLAQDERMSQDLPFGSRGGVAIHHTFPLDGDYTVKIRLRRQVYEYILGMGRPHQLEVRLNGARVKVFTVGGETHGKPAPLQGWAGNILGDTEWEAYMHTADAALDVRFPAKAGAGVIGVAFVKDSAEPEGILQPPSTGRGWSLDEWYDGNAAVESVSVGGPYDGKNSGETLSRRKIFVCTPANAAGEPACARKIISTLARRVYRRSVTEEDIRSLLEFYTDGYKQTGFEGGIRLALERILVDPDFLFRIERDPANLAPGTVYRLGDFQLASRLSFFLWSSIPDDQLLNLAAAGKLKDPKVLEEQARRMLADPRSNALVDNFVWQWLNLSKISGATPDPDIFPDFDENLRQAFSQETKLFVESQLAADHSVLDLLNADYTFVNERLARHYQIPNVYGERFRRVALADGQRGGLLGQGSVLMVTSYANRTSPVLRGKWLLDNILGMPPPPPPPNVPALKDTGANGKLASVRERMEQHRKNPACAVCHVRMDPMGFALENFDAIGTWRTTADGTAIDASGAFPDGTKFDGVSGLRKFLLTRREEFADTVTEKLLTYALGRGAESYDMPAVRKITREAAAADYRWSSIILGIIKTVPFQMGLTGSHDAKEEQGRSTE